VSELASTEAEAEQSPADPEVARAPVQITAPQYTIPPEPEPELGESFRPDQLGAEARRQLEILRDHAREPSAPPSSGRLDEFVWGLAQPLLGVRTLVSHGDLFVRGLIPAAAFILVCALVVDGGSVAGLWGLIAAYYAVLVSAASISPVVFCRNYAKLAAEARRHLDVPRREPYLRSYKDALIEAVVQAIVITIGVAPWVALVSYLPLFGGMWAAVIGALWVLHWIVVEALDGARTLPPDETPETLEQRHAKLDPPWYSGAALNQLRAPLGALLLPVRLWGIVMARLGRRWRGEVALIEARPWLAVGFGVGASVLLVIPVLNLLFRPAIVVAASHVLGRLEPELTLPELDDEPNAEDEIVVEHVELARVEPLALSPGSAEAR
jgi:hypothetical protein